MEDDYQWKITFIGEISRFRSAIYPRCGHFLGNSTHNHTWLKDDCMPICCSYTVVGTVYLCKICVEQRGNDKIRTF